MPIEPDPRDALIALIDAQMRALAGRDPWANVVGGLSTATAAAAAAAAEESRRNPVMNPKPAGTIEDGRSTRLVLDQFERTPNLWLRRQALLWRCPALTPKGCDWALLQLRRLGRIEARIAPGTGRFNLYRLIESRGTIGSRGREDD